MGNEDKKIKLVMCEKCKSVQEFKDACKCGHGNFVELDEPCETDARSRSCWICGKENLHADGVHTCYYRPEILELIEKAKREAVAEFVDKLREYASNYSASTLFASDLFDYIEEILPKEAKEVSE